MSNQKCHIPMGGFSSQRNPGVNRIANNLGILSRRDVNNSVAAWLRGIYRNNDTIDVFAEHRPLGVAQHDERNSAKP